MNAAWKVEEGASAGAIDPQWIDGSADLAFRRLIEAHPWSVGARPRPSRKATVQLTARERLARHEAAHAVIGVDRGAGVASAGIDLRCSAPSNETSEPPGVHTLAIDLAQPHQDQIRDLQDGLAIICAGAASDARLEGIGLATALCRQSDDLNQAIAFASQFSFVHGRDGLAGALAMGLQFAEARLAAPQVSAAVETVANACLAAGGRISAREIMELAAPPGD